MADAYVPNEGPFGSVSGSRDMSRTRSDELFARPRVITLCGSTRFMNEFEKQNRLLTLEGNVVLSVAAKAHEGTSYVTAEQKQLLDRVHLEKIRMADEIFVINVGGYIGESTSREIEFAKRLRKKVRYLVPLGAAR